MFYAYFLMFTQFVCTYCQFVTHFRDIAYTCCYVLIKATRPAWFTMHEQCTRWNPIEVIFLIYTHRPGILMNNQFYTSSVKRIHIDIESQMKHMIAIIVKLHFCWIKVTRGWTNCKTRKLLCSVMESSNQPIWQAIGHPYSVFWLHLTKIDHLEFVTVTETLESLMEYYNIDCDYGQLMKGRGNTKNAITVHSRLGNTTCRYTRSKVRFRSEHGLLVRSLIECI